MKVRGLVAAKAAQGLSASVVGQTRHNACEWVRNLECTIGPTMDVHVYALMGGEVEEDWQLLPSVRLSWLLSSLFSFDRLRTIENFIDTPASIGKHGRWFSRDWGTLMAMSKKEFTRAEIRPIKPKIDEEVRRESYEDFKEILISLRIGFRERAVPLLSRMLKNARSLFF